MNCKKVVLTLLFSAWGFYSLFPQNNETREITETLFNSGYNYLEVDNAKAIEVFSQCISHDSTYAEAYYYRGIGYFKSGLYDSALIDFSTAERLDSRFLLATVYKAFVYRKKEQYDSALYFFNEYIKNNPHDTLAFSLIIRGKLLNELQDFDGAISDFQHAIDLDPVKESYYYYYKYQVHFEKKEYQKALEQLKEAINLNPEFYGYYFLKGKTFFEMGKYSYAIEQYNIALEINNTNPELYYHRGLAYQTSGNLDEAILDYDAAIAYNHLEGTYFFQRGHAYLAMGDRFSACNDWSVAGGLGYFKDFDKIKEVCD